MDIKSNLFTTQPLVRINWKRANNLVRVIIKNTLINNYQTDGTAGALYDYANLLNIVADSFPVTISEELDSTCFLLSRTQLFARLQAQADEQGVTLNQVIYSFMDMDGVDIENLEVDSNGKAGLFFEITTDYLDTEVPEDFPNRTREVDGEEQPYVFRDYVDVISTKFTKDYSGVMFMPTPNCFINNAKKPVNPELIKAIILFSKFDENDFTSDYGRYTEAEINDMLKDDLYDLLCNIEIAKGIDSNLNSDSLKAEIKAWVLENY